MIAGYRLIRDSDGFVLSQWGGIYGQCAKLPDYIDVPNIETNAVDRVHCPLVGGVYGGFRLSEWDVDCPPPTESDYIVAIQEAVDDAARGRGYADGVALASYAASTNTLWKAESEAFIAWRDSVWIYAYDQLGRVRGGQIAQPTIADIIGGMPAIKWGNDVAALP